MLVLPFKHKCVRFPCCVLMLRLSFLADTGGWRMYNTLDVCVENMGKRGWKVGLLFKLSLLCSEFGCSVRWRGFVKEGVSGDVAMFVRFLFGIGMGSNCKRRIGWEVCVL